MMACLNLNELQQYLEDAEAETEAPRRTVDAHLAACEKCREVFDRVSATHRRVNAWLSDLASPFEDSAVDVRTALARFRVRVTPDSHLDRLLAPDSAEIPWYLSLYEQVRERIRPEKLPPLDVTSRPVPVRNIWGQYGSDPRSRYMSAGIHVAAFALLMYGFTSPAVRRAVLYDHHVLEPYIPALRAKPQAMQGGGGGGAAEALPVSKGQLPKPALKQFVPPQIVDHPPKLAMDPSIIAPPDTPLPQLALNNWGDPLAKLMNGSNGNGSGGGMGSGGGGGVGAGRGGGFGAGEGGSVGGGVFRVGGGVSAPAVLFKVDPEYSEDARKAKYSGTVLLSVVVDAEGHARDIHVLKSLGMGLDEKAMEAVQKWKFRPGMKGGKPVNVRAQIEVNFRLL